MIVSSAVSIYMVNNEYGYWSLVGMSLSKALVNSLLLIIFSKWYPRLVFSKDSFRELFSFGSKLLVAGVLGTIVQNLYSILIGRYFKVEQVGYFQQGHKFTDILSSTLSATIQGVTYPLMTSIQEDKTRLTQVYIKVMGIIMLVTFPVFFGFAAVSEEFVLVFLGEKWRPIIPVLVILCFARLITPISALNMNILNARGRSDLFLKTDLYKIPIIIVALFIAIPYGIVGVAFAQLFCVSISFFINAYYPGKLFGFGATEQLKQIIPIGIASLIMYLSMVMIKIDNLGIQMATKIIAGVGVYTAFCWAFKITAFRNAVKLTLSPFK
jgi:O-antigen/teichoic acid export membrane protein